jgi:hypothetical protein
MSFAVYGHLPAQGLGDRDPLRPYSTGGLGAGVFIFVVGPAGDIIVIYGSPVLEYIEAIVPGADPSLVVGVSFDPDLNWVQALSRLATLVQVNSPRDAELIFAQSHQIGLWRVVGDYQASAAAVLITAALTGAEAPSLVAELEHGSTLEVDLTGVFLPSTDAELYAGTVLSSQD